MLESIEVWHERWAISLVYHEYELPQVWVAMAMVCLGVECLSVDCLF